MTYYLVVDYAESFIGDVLYTANNKGIAMIFLLNCKEKAKEQGLECKVKILEVTTTVKEIKPEEEKEQ